MLSHVGPLVFAVSAIPCLFLLEAFLRQIITLGYFLKILLSCSFVHQELQPHTNTDADKVQGPQHNLWYNLVAIRVYQIYQGKFDFNCFCLILNFPSQPTIQPIDHPTKK